MESTENSTLCYEHCFVNFHADFLTGTTSKIERYQEPVFYKKLFEIFRNNLIAADKLIIIGYGCKDSEINKMIIQNFDFQNKPVIIIDPFPSQTLENFQETINATLIKKNLEEITLGDIP